MFYVDHEVVAFFLVVVSVAWHFSWALSTLQNKASSKTSASQGLHDNTDNHVLAFSWIMSISIA